jgi:hypothetical protein
MPMLESFVSKRVDFKASIADANELAKEEKNKISIAWDQLDYLLSVLSICKKKLKLFYSPVAPASLVIPTMVAIKDEFNEFKSSTGNFRGKVWNEETESS